MFLSLKHRSRPRHSRWWNIDPDRMGVLVFTTLKTPEPANLLTAGGVGMSGEGLHVEGRSRTKRKMRRGDTLWLGAATPKKCCRLGGGVAGTTGCWIRAHYHRMAPLGLWCHPWDTDKREGKQRRVTVGREMELERGEPQGGLTKKTCRDDPQMAAENRQWKSLREPQIRFPPVIIELV